MPLEISSFESNGHQMRFALYSQDDNSAPRHYVFLLPGRAEYIEKYEMILHKFSLPRGTTLVLVDHRGQGDSGGHPFHISTYKEFCSDLKNLVEKLTQKNETYSILASSMGGLIALYGNMQRYFMPEKIFLCCPLLGLPKSSLWLSTAYLISTTFHGLGRGKKRWRNYALAKTFEDNILTDNRQHYEFLKKPIHEPQEGTYTWIRATLHALNYVQHAGNVKTLCKDLTFCIATRELVVSNESIYRFIRKIQRSKEDFTLDLHAFKTKHELFFDKEEETHRLFKVINRWLSKKEDL